MSDTQIEWADKAWNPITGCSKISTGCQNCYAERFAKRLAGRCGYPTSNPFSITFHGDNLADPKRWKKGKRVFVCSMGDLFHELVLFDMRARVFDTMLSAPQHTYMLLTKRADIMAEFVFDYLACMNLMALPQNIWLGTSVENQDAVWQRVPELMKLHNVCSTLWVSYEPALGPVNLRPWLLPTTKGGPYLSWVVAGGETGPGARVYYPGWIENLLDQCQETGCPVFFKSWGDWREFIDSDHDWQFLEDNQHTNKVRIVFPDGRSVPAKEATGDLQLAAYMLRMGKKHSGRLVYGREFNEYPVPIGGKEDE